MWGKLFPARESTEAEQGEQEADDEDNSTGSHSETATDAFVTRTFEARLLCLEESELSGLRCLCKCHCC